MRRLMPVIAAVSLATTMAACGGDDDGAVDEVEAPAPATSPDTDDEAPSPTDPPPAPTTDVTTAPDPDATDPTMPDLGDLGQLGPEELEALAALGFDIDDLGDLEALFENLGDFGDLDDLDLDAMFEGLDEFMSGFGGDGGGTVTVDGVAYELSSDSCISFGDDFFIDGPAVGSDGSEAWINISRDVTTRDEMANFMDEAMIDNLFGDSDVMDETYLEIRVGATSRFDTPDDQPAWNAMSESDWSFGDAIIDVEFTGNGLQGSGQAEDQNAIALDFGETAPIEFQVACS